VRNLRVGGCGFGLGAGKKLEARKLLENGAESHTLGAPKKMVAHHFLQVNVGDVLRTLCGRRF